MTSRSQAADLACAARLQARLQEQITFIGRQRANHFCSQLERDEFLEFMRDVEDAIGRLTLRVGQAKQEAA